MNPTIIRVDKEKTPEEVSCELKTALMKMGVVDEAALNSLTGLMEQHMSSTLREFSILLNPFRAIARYSKTARVHTVGDIEVFFYPGNLVTYYVPSTAGN